MHFLKTKKTWILFGLLLTSMGSLAAEEKRNLLTVREIKLNGNVRIHDNIILNLIPIKEGMQLTEKTLTFKLKTAQAKLEATKLFMFVEMNYIVDDNNITLYVSVGENVIFLDMIALQDGSFTRFSSISKDAPDFGFLAGGEIQSLYFRFPDLFNSSTKLITSITHHAYDIDFYPSNVYFYEAARVKLAIETVVFQNFKLKAPVNYRYNITGASQARTSDFNTGLEALADFSHYKDVIHIGFDVYGGVYRSFMDYSYTTSNIGMNIYLKPFSWEELILRGRYASVLDGSLPDYQLYRIDNAYQVRGNITQNYFGERSLVLNLENWFRNIFTVPVSLTNINFSLLVFADLGKAGGNIAAINMQDWSLSVGGALSVDFNAPLNISMQFGYGQEIWQNTGGSFYVKIGYLFYQGDFYE